jgi:aminoglycoside phosphotransferase (APT) family kinase protein
MWFKQRMPEAEDLKLGDFSIPEASGMSNITLIFDLNWKSEGRAQSRSCVARVQPPSGTLVFEEYDMILQYNAMQAVSDVVPVPELIGMEQDSSIIGSQFYIMGKLEGRVPPDMPPLHMDGWVKNELSPSEREKLWWSGLEQLCKVHTVDWRKSLGVLDKPERGGAHAGAQFLHKMERYLEWSPDPSYDLPEYRRALQWLHDHRDKNEVTGLCWGDARMGNTMFAPQGSEVIAILDWEMVDLCNPIKDLAWWCTLDHCTSTLLGVARLEGMPSEQESIRYWHKMTGLDDKQYNYYKLAVLYYFGLILTRTAMCADNPDPLGSNFVTPEVQRFLDELGAPPAKS